jgi:hypothetical protein
MGVIDSTVTDAAHTGYTHILRQGLALTRKASDGIWYATVSGDTYDGILYAEVDLKDGDTSNDATDHTGNIVIAGAVDAGQILGIHADVTGVNNRLLVLPTATG